MLDEQNQHTKWIEMIDELYGSIAEWEEVHANRIFIYYKLLVNYIVLVYKEINSIKYLLLYIYRQALYK